MKNATITYVEQTPDWSIIPVISIDRPYQNSPDDIHAYAQICYSSEMLHLHLWAEEPRIRAVEAGPLGKPWQDSCLEFFFRPDPEDMRYFNFEFNPNGCIFLGIGSPDFGLTRLLPDDVDGLFAIKILKTKKRWDLQFHIPSNFIWRFFPTYEAAPGKSISANFYKCGDLTTPPHYYSWNPVDGEPLSFHRPECFACLFFE